MSTNEEDDRPTLVACFREQADQLAQGVYVGHGMYQREAALAICDSHQRLWAKVAALEGEVKTVHEGAYNDGYGVGHEQGRWEAEEAAKGEPAEGPSGTSNGGNWFPVVEAAKGESDAG